jgi:hypothetical protein
VRRGRIDCYRKRVVLDGTTLLFAVLAEVRAIFLKVWLRATRREAQIPFGNDNENKDSASEEKAVRAMPSGKLL